MKKRIIALSLCLILAVAVSVSALGTLFAWIFVIEEKPLGITSEVSKAYFEGEGTEESPFLIAQPVQLYYFAWLQDMGYYNDDGTNAANGYMEAPVYFKVTANLDMTGYTLPAIGTADQPFMGVFDGDYHVISNLTVTNADTVYQQPAHTDDILGAQIVGFFGVIGALDPAYVYDSVTPTAQNFALSNVTVRTDDPTDDVSLIGIVAGYVNGVVENVLVADCTVAIASGIGALAYTTNQSDYTLVGYAAQSAYVKCVATLNNSEAGYGPGSGTGGGNEQGDQFGGSINMLNLYNRVVDIRDNYATSTTGQVPNNQLQFSYTYANGGGSDYNETKSFSSYANITNNGYSNIKTYSSTGDSTMGAASFSYNSGSTDPNADTHFVYLSGAEVVGIDYTIYGTNESAFAIKTNSGNNYLNLNTGGTGYTTGTSASTYWRISDQGHLYGTVTVSGKTVVRFLNAKYATTSTTSPLFVSEIPTTKWVKASNTLRLDYSSNRYLQYKNSKWYFSSSSVKLSFSTTKNVSKITYKLIYGSQKPADTYLPLIVDNDYNALRKNTGYIVSGAAYHNMTGSASSSYPYNSGDIRVSKYQIYGTSNGQNYDLSGSVSNSSATGDIKVITRTAAYNGWVTIKDNDSMTAATGFTTLKTPAELGLQKYQYVDEDNQGTKAALTTLLQEGNGSVYGLHFMDAQISMDNLMTARRVQINGATYDNYQMPRDCIDFYLKKDGVINFYAGTYFSGNNAFFALYKIERDEDTQVITEIKEITAVYKKTGQDDTVEIAYRFAGESNPPTGFTTSDLVFDTSWLTNPGSNCKYNYLYYFEIPAVVGEYALGSVSGQTGAYLLYLDISASGGSAQENDVVSQFTNQYETFDLPTGIQLATAAEVAAFTSSTVVDDTDAASVALSAFSGSIRIAKETENDETVYMSYLNDSETGQAITGTTRYEIVRVSTSESGGSVTYTLSVSGLHSSDFYDGAYSDVVSFAYSGADDISEFINCVFRTDNTYEVTFDIETALTITDFTALNGYSVTARSIGSGTLTTTS